MNMESQPRWNPVDRSKSGGAQPEKAGRMPVRLRSAEEQAAYRARTEGERAQSEPKAERADAKAETQASDLWESRRQELAARGDIFDAKGNVTPGGQKVLIESGWNMRQVVQIEGMQKNQVGEVSVIRESAPVRETAAMSARERPQVLADARAAAERALQERAQSEAAARKAQGERAMAGMRARSNAVYAGKSEADADRVQREAEQRYDLQKQQEQNLRAAS